MAFGTPPATTPKKRGFGCLGCGCALLILVVLLVIGLCFGMYHAALNLTDAAAESIPQADGGAKVYDTAQHKIADFQAEIEHDKPATLHLTSDEINTYIARDPSMAAVHGRLFVKLQGSEATIQSSVPLSAFETTFMANRFVNCDATLSLAFDPQSKSITVDLHDLSLKGQLMPASTNATLNQTLNSTIEKQIQASAPARDFLARTQKIAIENGELVIETR